MSGVPTDAIRLCTDPLVKTHLAVSNVKRPHPIKGFIHRLTAFIYS